MTAALVATVSVIPLAGAAPQAETVRYEGSLRDGQTGSVSLRVKQREEERDLALFLPDPLRLSCEQGTPMVARPQEEPMKFSSARSFELMSVREGPVRGWYTFYRIHGELLSDRRARGYLFYYVNPYDPPSGPSSDGECSTAGKVQWSATTARGGRR